VGQGTTFTVALPAGRSASLPADAGATAHKPGDPTRQAYVLEALRWLPDPVAAGHDIAPVNDVQAASAAPETIPRIVVADDNADMREYIGRLLTGRWAVETVADGVQALGAIRQRRPDLVLTDVMMPNLDGFGLLRALRDDPSFSVDARSRCASSSECALELERRSRTADIGCLGVRALATPRPDFGAGGGSNPGAEPLYAAREGRRPGATSSTPRPTATPAPDSSTVSEPVLSHRWPSRGWLRWLTPRDGRSGPDISNLRHFCQPGTTKSLHD